MPPEIDLFRVDRGSVTAPAGCGKTQLIADTLSIHDGQKPILILTHTNAGAAALRLRLKRAQVPNSAFTVATLDGFAIKIIGMFPRRSGHAPLLLEIRNPSDDYPAIRSAATQLIRNQHITDVLKATYSRLIADEYQDCNLIQHELVNTLSLILPTVVLGDPLQAIFDFGGNQLVNWQQHVEVSFPPIGTLNTPWRWRNADREVLGQWLLDVRQRLIDGSPVNLRQAPQEVVWIQINNQNADQERRRAAQIRTENGEYTVLIIGDSRNPQGRNQLTSQTPGATAVEAVDYRDLVSFARSFDLNSENALESFVNFASDFITQVGPANFLSRIQTIRNGRSRTEPSSAEIAAVAFSSEPSFERMLDLLSKFENQENARVYRPEIFRCLSSALGNSSIKGTPLIDEVLAARESQRHHGRVISRRAVGSTLLLKGLEADVAVILNPEHMNAANLYVALTRGAKRLIICSSSHELTPV
ncbi:MAG: DNA helicase UvrD [Betaproteobacteria bacterium HGW-Betaproteobacteria-22]|nr:MAG: DNA helicase UvrD [Betaproteobacteria bacterium HGW-Betaproteobacteria-22]